MSAKMQTVTYFIPRGFRFAMFQDHIGVVLVLPGDGKAKGMLLNPDLAGQLALSLLAMVGGEGSLPKQPKPTRRKPAKRGGR